MRLTFCIACDAREDLQHHHLVTKAEGGSDDNSNLITLCAACHDKLHRRQSDGTYDHRARTIAGRMAAKDIGRARRLSWRTRRPSPSCSL
jgi:HNH endonuclease